MNLQNLKMTIRSSFLTLLFTFAFFTFSLKQSNVPLAGDVFVYKEFSEYKMKLRMDESRDIKDTVNRQGYMGLYQFGLRTLKGIKAHKLMPDSVQNDDKKIRQYFLSNREIQERTFILYTKYNRKLLKKYIEKYHETYYNGHFITESGILAAAHAKGAGGVKKFFDKGINSYDINGCNTWGRMKAYSGYKISL